MVSLTETSEMPPLRKAGNKVVVMKYGSFYKICDSSHRKLCGIWAEHGIWK